MILKGSTGTSGSWRRSKAYPLAGPCPTETAPVWLLKSVESLPSRRTVPHSNCTRLAPEVGRKCTLSQDRAPQQLHPVLKRGKVYHPSVSVHCLPQCTMCFGFPSGLGPSFPDTLLSGSHLQVLTHCGLGHTGCVHIHECPCADVPPDRQVRWRHTTGVTTEGITDYCDLRNYIG